MKQVFVILYLGWLIGSNYLYAQTDCQPTEASKIPDTISSVSDSGQCAFELSNQLTDYSKIPENNDDPPAFLINQLHHDTTVFDSLACRTPAEWRFLTFYPNTIQELDVCYHSIAYRALAIDPISTITNSLCWMTDTLTSVERMQLLSEYSAEPSNTDLAENNCEQAYLTDTNINLEILKNKELQDFINYYNCPRQYSIPFSELASYYKSRYDIELAEDRDNIELYAIVTRWLKVPYRYGGTTRHGMDCAAFTMLVCDSIFGKHLYRSANDQYRNILPIQKDELQEGDLVFFKINKSRISHVGIYLKNNKFVHATVNEGIVISDLNENYYRRYWFGAGRLSNQENNDFSFPTTATAATNATRKAQ